MQTLIFKDFVIPQRNISRKKISDPERIERGKRFSAYLERYFPQGPSFIVNYKPTSSHINFRESEILGFKKGGYGIERKGFLSDNKALDFIEMIKAKFPEIPSPRFEYLTCQDNIMTSKELDLRIREIERKIEKHKRNIETLEKEKESLINQYAKERD